MQGWHSALASLLLQRLAASSAESNKNSQSWAGQKAPCTESTRDGAILIEPLEFQLWLRAGVVPKPQIPCSPNLCGQSQPCLHIQTASGFHSLGAEFFLDAASCGEGGKVQDQPPALLHLMEAKPARSNPLGCISGYFSPAQQPGARSDSVPQ